MLAEITRPVPARLRPVHEPEVAMQRPTRYLTTCAMTWLGFWLVSILTATKLFQIGALELSVAVLTYPVTYIFSDIFTEVYGYRQSRRILWSGMMIVLLASTLIALMVSMPPSSSYADQDAFNKIFSAAPGITVAAMLAFFSGELVNSFIMAKLKLATAGHHLWLRTTSSTAAGQLVDNFVFFFAAYTLSNAYDNVSFWNVALATAAFCTLYEFAMTPVTYKIVRFLKRSEGMDVYDHATNFNPLRFD